MDGLVKDRGVVGDVDKHGDLPLPHSLPLPDEVVLEETGQLALTKRDHSILTTPTERKVRVAARIIDRGRC